MAKNDNENTKSDIFILRSIFPEAGAIFSTRPKSLEDIKDDCYVVLDASALLVPYAISSKSLEEVRRTYATLIGEERLVIPGRAAREFARNRAAKIGETYQQLYIKHSQVPGRLKLDSYPLLESLEEYQEVLRLQKAFNETRRQYSEAIGNLLDHIRGWTWDDPVSALYGELFTGDVILDPPFSAEEIESELVKRKQHNIPPGYKDSTKPDGGVGDLLIWYTILEVGATRKKSVIFVSGDEKADWRCRSEKQLLYPRYELFDEFRRCSEGETFHIIEFSRFLDLYGASEEVVEEVRRKEMQIPSMVKKLASEMLGDYHYWAREAEDAVAEWLMAKYPGVRTRPTTRPDYSMADAHLVLEPGNIGIYISFCSAASFGPGLEKLLMSSAFHDVRSGVFDSGILVLVGNSEDEAYALAGRLVPRERSAIGVLVVVGYITSDRKFVEVGFFE